MNLSVCNQMNLPVCNQMNSSMTKLSTKLANNKNSLGAAEDHTGSDNKKVAISIEDISVPERSKASILYVYIIVSIEIAFVSYIAEING